MALSLTDSFKVNHNGNPLEISLQDVLDLIEQHLDSLSGAALTIADLPTADPLVVGQLWNNTGVVTVSAGE